jgi:hypothetical protein
MGSTSNGASMGLQGWHTQTMPNHAHLKCTAPHAEDKTMVQTEEVKDAHDLTLGWGHGKYWYPLVN